MRMPRCNRPGLGALVAVLLLALVFAPAGTQERQGSAVVSNRISVSTDDATLHLELADDSELEIALRDGRVMVDGESVGEYADDSELETAWRSLLGDAVALGGGSLARALRDWDPPEGLDGEALELARRIDRTLETRLTVRPPEASPAPDPARRAPDALRDLLRKSDRLVGLAGALEGLSLDDLQIRVDEDVVVGPDEELDGTLVVVGGDLDVRGAVRGDVILTDGELRVRDGGRIDGEVRLVDARIFRDDGEIGGAVRDVSPDEALDPGSLDDLRDRVRSQVRDELRDELRSELRRELRDRTGPGVFAPLRNVGRGIAGLLQNLISLAIAGVLAIVVIHFFSTNLEVVADTARRSPARAAVVGTAGSFLLVPAWILGMVALAISIIGIPALIAWIPLFPLAAALAAGLGYLAAARVIGEWVAEQRFQGLDFLRPSNTVHTVLTGLGVLVLPFAAANVVSMAGHWLHFVQGVLTAVGVLGGIAAVAVGFGAVLLTRAGRRPEYAPTPDPADMSWPGGSGGTAPGTEEEWDDLERDARRRTKDEPTTDPENGTDDPEASPEAEDGHGG